MRPRTSADDTIRTSMPARNPPNPNEPWIRALASAVILRAFRDAKLVRYYKHPRDRNRKYELQRDALLWARDGGPEFDNWCELAGVDPDATQRAIVEVSVGLLPDGVHI